MDKAVEMGKSSATGSFYLLIGVALSTVIMALGTIVLGTLLSPEDLGLYGLALVPATMINFFRDWGVNSALTQQIASLRVAGKNAEIHDVIYSGVIFEIITGVICSVVCFAVAEPLAYFISPQNVGNLTIYISIMSISVFAGALAAAAGGIFVGFERMKLNSATQILSAIIKTALGPLLIVLGFGILGAIYAASISLVAGGVIAILLVYFALYRPIRKCKVGKCDIKKTLKPMLSYGLPLTVSSIVIGVLPQVFALTMGSLANLGDSLAGRPEGWMMGNYYASSYFGVLLTFISFPVATALFPVFSKIDPEKEHGLIKTVFSSSVKYTAMLLVPSTMLIIALATPLINFIFPVGGILHSLFVVDAVPKYPYAPLFLALSCMVYLLVLFGNITLGTFQTGIKKTRQVMWQSVVSLVIGVLLAVFMVEYFYKIGGSSYAVVGGILGSLIATIPNVAWGLYWSWKHYKVKADYTGSAKIFIASLIAAVAAYLLTIFLALPYFAILILGFALFAVVYLVAAPLIGAINTVDIENFKNMFASIRLIRVLLDLPLNFMLRLCRKQSDSESELTEKILSGETSQ